MMMVSYNNDDDVVCSHYDDGDDFSVDGGDDGNDRVQYDITQRELGWEYRSAVCPKEGRGCPSEAGIWVDTNDACGLDDDDTLRKQVFCSWLRSFLLRYLEEVKDEASEDIQ